MFNTMVAMHINKLSELRQFGHISYFIIAIVVENQFICLSKVVVDKINFKRATHLKQTKVA